MSDTSSLLTNSVWPNGLKEDSEGYAVFYPLGTNKVDVSAITWPTGSKVISPFVYDTNDKLVGLIDTKAIINQNKTVLDLPSNYTTFKVELSDEFIALRKSSNCTNFDVRYAHDKNYSGSITSADIDADLKSYIQGATKVIDNILYDANNNIIGSFNTNSITDGECSPEGENKIFSTDITVFESDLSNLTNGSCMFYKTNLASFASDLSKLTNGWCMFNYCSSLTSFSGDLSSLPNGSSMFSDCTSLTSFNGDLSSLTNGMFMFNGCTNLTSFTSNLSSLVYGSIMFDGCKLDAPSVKNIITTIKDNGTSKSITIGINVTNDSSTIQSQLLAFANEVGYNTWADLKTAFTNKHWNVTWQYGGTSSSITLSEDEQFRSVPIYAQLIEEENSERAEYCTEDGTKYYNINWGHDVNNYDEFQYFGSLLEACGYYGVIPKKYLETV